MHGARDEFLARSTFSANQDGDVGVGDALDELTYFAHGHARAQQFTGHAL
jgi:hypothetical protein